MLTRKKLLVIHPGVQLDFTWSAAIPAHFHEQYDCVHTNKGQFNEGKLVADVDIVVIDGTESLQHAAIWSVLKGMLQHYLPKARVAARWHDPAKAFVEPPADIQALLQFRQHDIVGDDAQAKVASMMQHMDTYVSALEGAQETKEKDAVDAKYLIRSVKIGCYTYNSSQMLKNHLPEDKFYQLLKGQRVKTDVRAHYSDTVVEITWFSLRTSYHEHYSEIFQPHNNAIAGAMDGYYFQTKQGKSKHFEPFWDTMRKCYGKDQKQVIAFHDDETTIEGFNSEMGITRNFLTDSYDFELHFMPFLQNIIAGKKKEPLPVDYYELQPKSAAPVDEKEKPLNQSFHSNDSFFNLAAAQVEKPLKAKEVMKDFKDKTGYNLNKYAKIVAMSAFSNVPLETLMKGGGGSDYGSDDDYGEEASEEAKAIKDAENASHIEAAMQSDLSYRVNELSVSYNGDEESKVDVADAQKTKIQARVNIFGAAYEDSLFEAKNLFQQLGMQTLEHHEQEGGERLAFIKFEFDLKPGAADELSPLLQQINAHEQYLNQKPHKQFQKHGLDFKHAFNFVEGRGEISLIIQLPRSVKSFPHIPMLNQKIVEALENYNQGFTVDVEVNSNLKKMILGGVPLKDVIRTAFAGHAKLEYLACFPKLLQVDESVGGFMKLMSFFYQGIQSNSSIKLSFDAIDKLAKIDSKVKQALDMTANDVMLGEFGHDAAEILAYEIDPKYTGGSFDMHEPDPQDNQNSGGSDSEPEESYMKNFFKALAIFQKMFKAIGAADEEPCKMRAQLMCEGLAHVEYNFAGHGLAEAMLIYYNLLLKFDILRDDDY